MAWWEYVSGQYLATYWVYHRTLPSLFGLFGDDPVVAAVLPGIRLPVVTEGAPVPLLYGRS
jgi:hypothetical protein